MSIRKNSVDDIKHQRRLTAEEVYRNELVMMSKNNNRVPRVFAVWKKISENATIIVLLMVLVFLIVLYVFSEKTSDSGSRDVSSVSQGHEIVSSDYDVSSYDDSSYGGTYSFVPDPWVSLPIIEKINNPILDVISSNTSSEEKQVVYYWTSTGFVYHSHIDCQALLHAKDLYAGTLEEVEYEKERLCKFCQARD